MALIPPCIRMPEEKSPSFFPRPRRYPLVAEIELLHLQSAMRLRQTISDISPFGCHVSTRHMWPIGSHIEVRIRYNEKTFSALAKVIYDRPMLGMGVAFTQIEPDDQPILDAWIAELRRLREKA